MGWEQLENGPAVTAAARPLPPIPRSAIQWTNAHADAAYRRGLADGERRAREAATKNAVRAAAAAVAPKPTPARPTVKPAPRPARTARPKPPEPQGLRITMPGHEPMLLVKEKDL